MILRLVVRFPLIGSDTPGFLAPRGKAKARSDLAAELQFFRVIFLSFGSDVMARARKPPSYCGFQAQRGDSFRDNFLFWITMLLE